MSAPPDPASRRSFLASLGAFVALLGGPFAFLGRKLGLGGRRGKYVAQRIPVWHPGVSGYHGDTALTVRRDLGNGVGRETVLHGIEARLWCLCGGDLSEADLVRSLVAEMNMDPAEARRRVVAFLEPLYRQGYLLPATAERLASRSSNEVECRPGFREFPCRPPTS
jgi:hypothetical protein